MTAVSYPLNEKVSCYKNKMRRKIGSQLKSVSVTSISVRFQTTIQNEQKRNEKFCLLTRNVVYSGRNVQAFRGAPTASVFSKREAADSTDKQAKQPDYT